MNEREANREKQAAVIEIPKTLRRLLFERAVGVLSGCVVCVSCILLVGLELLAYSYLSTKIQRSTRTPQLLGLTRVRSA